MLCLSDTLEVRLPRRNDNSPDYCLVNKTFIHLISQRIYYNITILNVQRFRCLPEPIIV